MDVYRFPKILYDEAKASYTVTDGFFFVPAQHLLRIDQDDGPVVKIHSTAGSFWSHFSGDEIMELIEADVVAL